MKQWMMPNDFQPKLGHRFTFRRPPIPQLNFDGISHCEVTVLEPPERLEFTFVGGGLDTVVRFRLVPQGQGTHLFFEHAGFDTDHPAQKFAFQNMSGGWKDLGDKLDRVVEARQ